MIEYSFFELEIIGGHGDILDEICEKNEYKSVSYAIDSDGEYLIDWPDHEYDMTLISGQYPELVFKLSVEGELASDLCVKYFKNGLIQRCPAKITYEEYNESKLEYRQ